MITQKEYWTEVKSIVEELREEIKRGNVTSVDEADEWITQTVDGHEWVIYTAKSLAMLSHTKHDEDAFDLNEGVAGCKTTGEVYARLAYFGLLGDVMEEAGDLEALFGEAFAESEEETAEKDEVKS